MNHLIIKRQENIFFIAHKCVDTLPPEQDTPEALEGIRTEVIRAASVGDVLFMDQCQLLTFVYMRGVLLVPEYDKRVLIVLKSYHEELLRVSS